MNRDRMSFLAWALAAALGGPGAAALGAVEAPVQPWPEISLAAASVLPLQGEAAQPGHEPPAAELAAEDRWWFLVDFTIWLPGISGDVGARGVTAHVNASFTDILDNSDSVIGLTGNFEFGRGKFGGYVMGFWSRTGQNVPVPLGNVDITSDMAVMGFGASYEVGRWPMEYTARADKPARDLTLRAYVGGRYTSVSNDFDFVLLPDRKESKGWVDPMLGAGALVPFAPDWSMVVRGEVGGFGAASDFAWMAAMLFSWDTHIGELPSSLQFGYMAIGDDYSSGSGVNKFVWDTILHGIVLNFEIRF